MPNTCTLTEEFRVASVFWPPRTSFMEAESTHVFHEIVYSSCFLSMGEAEKYIDTNINIHTFISTYI